MVAGLALIGVEGRGGTFRPALAWALLCALCIAGYHVCYKCALSAGSEPTAVFAAALGVALPVNLGRLGLGGVRRVGRTLCARPWVLGASGALCAASFLLLLAALSRGGAGAVLTLRNISVVFALLLAWSMGERPRGQQVAGTLSVVLGAAMLGWPR